MNPRDAPWGKFDQDTSATHHLAHHMVDVAAVFLEIANQPIWLSRLERAARRALAPLDLERLAALVYLHDAGKLFSSFQAKGWTTGRWRGPTGGHVKEGARVFFCSELEHAARALNVEALVSWNACSDLMLAIFAHHGRPLKASERRAAAGEAAVGWSGDAVYDPFLASQQLGEAMRTWFPRAFEPAGEPLPDGPEFDHLVAGLTALADWIGSHRGFFEFVADFEPDYGERARKRANDAVAAIGLDTDAAMKALANGGPIDFRRVSGFDEPNPQQKMVGSSAIEAQLLILEAETGSGKTEAALWRFAQLFADRRVNGFYFAVPTRAAAMQMHKRVCRAATRLFGEGTLEPVLALPGYLRSGDHEGGRFLTGGCFGTTIPKR